MAEEPKIHLLAEPRATTALTLLGICGVGWGAMIAQFIALGIVLSVLGALSTVWLYFNDMRVDLSSRRGLKKITAVPKPLMVASFIISIEIVFPIWILFLIFNHSELVSQEKNDVFHIENNASNIWIIWAVAVLFTSILVFSFARDRRDINRSALANTSSAIASSNDASEKVDQDNFVFFELAGGGFGQSPFRFAKSADAKEMYEELWVSITALRFLRNVRTRFVVIDDDGREIFDWASAGEFHGDVNADTVDEFCVSRRTLKGGSCIAFPDSPSAKEANLGAQFVIKVIVTHADGPGECASFMLRYQTAIRPESEVSILNNGNIKERNLLRPVSPGMMFARGPAFR